MGFCCSDAKSCQTFCNPITAAHQASLFFTISWNLLKLKSFELVMLPNHLTLCPSLLLLSSILPSIRDFSKAERNQQNANRFPEVDRRSAGVRLQSIRKERDAQRERTQGRYSAPFGYQQLADHSYMRMVEKIKSLSTTNWYLPWALATHSSILAWKIPWTKEPGRLQSMGSQRIGHD